MKDIPMTPGVRMLIDKEISFVPHLYRYEEYGGTAHSAKELNVPEHNIVKTLVMQTDERKPLIVLMHGDREVSAKNLARFMNVKSVQLCEAATAQRFTGYQFGGTSPFGTRTSIPVFVEKSIFALDKIYINGGKRGFLVEIKPTDLRAAFAVTEVEVAITV